MTNCDCVWGFTQIPIDEATQELLTLTTRRGLLHPHVLYFGAKQGPSIFQRLMDMTFGGLRDEAGDEFTSIFIDDVNIATEKLNADEPREETEERHIRHLELFFEAARERKISFKLVKSRWMFPQVDLLGFVVGSRVRKVDAGKAKALRDWPDPSCLEDIVSMRAYANYIREYIPNFADMDVHLRPYLKKGARIAGYQKDDHATKAYSDMRASVAEDAELACVDYRLAAKGIAGGCPLELYIDASDYAWAATLAQRPAPEKAPRPIAVFNKSFTTTETSRESSTADAREWRRRRPTRKGLRCGC